MYLDEKIFFQNEVYQFRGSKSTICGL